MCTCSVGADEASNEKQAAGTLSTGDGNVTGEQQNRSAEQQASPEADTTPGKQEPTAVDTATESSPLQVEYKGTQVRFAVGKA